MRHLLCAAAGAALALSSVAFAEQAPSAQAGAAAQAQGATPPAQAAGAASASYTETQLRAFVAASAEIAPVMDAANGAALNPTQVETIRGALTRNQIDSATYNAIAARTRTDAQFAARVNALRPTRSE